MVVAPEMLWGLVDQSEGRRDLKSHFHPNPCGYALGDEAASTAGTAVA